MNEEWGVQAAPIFSDGMVLQRDVPLRLWGTARPNEQLEAFFRGTTFSFASDGEGSWVLELPPQAPGGPFELVIKGPSGNLVLKDVLVGDVWLLGGQSNMELPISRTLDLFAAEVEGAENPWIRQFRVPITHNFQGPQKELPRGTWQAVNPQTVLEFSALGYFFAKAHYERYQIPVGLVLTAVGGSRIEAWLPEERVQALGGYEEEATLCKQPGYVDGVLRSELDRWLRWFEEQDAADLGSQPGSIPWSDPALDDTEWDTVTVPGLWRDTALENHHGVVWLRRKVFVNERDADKEALLCLGAIVDVDTTFINGVQVGKTESKYLPRKYRVPRGVLRPGMNTIAIRIAVLRSTGGFVPRKNYCLKLDSQAVDLSGEWKYRVGCSANSLPILAKAHYKPSGMFNAMISPLQGVAFRGVLWYQGEGNAHNAHRYLELMTALIADWRQHFGDPKLPFLFVQLPNYDTSLEGLEPDRWALLREAQLKALQIPYTAMAVTIDVGEAMDLHPQNKKEIGLRLALAARKLVFKEPITAQGPLFERLEREDGALRVFFTEVDGGLRAQDGELRWFEVCGEDGVFYPAQAQIEGESVRVWSERVADPRGVRYAWHANPEGANLYNAVGLPASPFRSFL